MGAPAMTVSSTIDVLKDRRAITVSVSPTPGIRSGEWRLPRRHRSS